MRNMPNQIFWKCPQHPLRDGALLKRDCLARALGGPNAPTSLGFSSLKIGMCHGGLELDGGKGEFVGAC